MAIFDIFALLQARVGMEEAADFIVSESARRQTFIDESMVEGARDHILGLVPVKGISCSSSASSDPNCCDVRMPQCLDVTVTTDPQSTFVTVSYVPRLLIVDRWRGLIGTSNEKALSPSRVAVTQVFPAITNQPGGAVPAIFNRSPEDE